MSPLVPVFGIVGALLGAVLIGYLGSAGSVLAWGIPVFALCGVFAYLVQWLMFVHAWTNRTESLYDLTGSITYVVMIVAAVVLSANYSPQALFIAGLIIVWAGRLGPFLYRRIKSAGEDRRFRQIKQNFGLFLMTWTLQGTWVFITASCALAAITSRSAGAVDAYFLAGGLMWLVGFAIEVVADRQKSAFRSAPANQDHFITTGLWAWSRHPNYFGEIILWLGIAVIAYPGLVGLQIYTLISPLFVVLLLTAISGVRMLETRGDKRWGDDPEYQAYKQRTPVLVMWPPKG